jgi:NACalpha-BTF3-like transcription factor
MSRLSPNSLFHFTPDYENLLGILKNTFYPRYCLEQFDLVDNDHQHFVEDAIPMVCFCDIPLSQLMSHIDTYGNYGLGMTKEWGIRKGLNPVIYFSKNSNLAKKLNILTNKSVWQNDENSRAFHEVMLYFKPYEGTLYRGGKTKQRVRFYDEHEWRYTPDRSNLAIKNIKMSLQKHVYRDTIQLANENQKLETDLTRLDFTADDIKYVIIKTEEEINGMIEALTRIKGNRYDRDTLNRLTSRIITVEQIQEDF